MLLLALRDAVAVSLEAQRQACTLSEEIFQIFSDHFRGPFEDLLQSLFGLMVERVSRLEESATTDTVWVVRVDMETHLVMLLLLCDVGCHSAVVVRVHDAPVLCDVLAKMPFIVSITDIPPRTWSRRLMDSSPSMATIVSDKLIVKIRCEFDGT